MAVGDKKPVVMEADRAVANGVATLDGTGKLTEDQRPDYEMSKVTGLEDALAEKADNAEVSAKLETLQETATQIQIDTTQLKTDVEEVKTNVESVKTDVGSVKTDVAGVKEDVGTVKEDIAGVKSDVSGVKSDVAGVKADVKNINVLLNMMKPQRFGWCIDENESDPDGRVTYLYDATGMTAAKMGASSFEYGSFAGLWFVRDNHVCLLNADRTENCILNPSDYAKKQADNSAAPITDTSGTLNVMSAIPTVWVRRWYDSSGKSYFSACEEQYDDTYHAYAHTDSTGRVCKWAYHGAYEGCLNGAKLMSLSGQTPINTKDATAERTAAAANGSGWDIRTHMFDALIQDLLILMGKSTHTQKVFGRGHDTGGTSAANLLTTGTLNTKGQFWGDQSGNAAVKVFHMENYWADRWDRIVGLLFRNGEFIVKPTPENGGFNLTGSGFTSTGVGFSGLAATGSGWQAKCIMTPYGRFQVGPFNGSDSTYNADFLWWNSNIVSGPLSGGACDAGLGCGALCRSVDSLASGAAWHIGASPSCLSPL